MVYQGLVQLFDSCKDCNFKDGDTSNEPAGLGADQLAHGNLQLLDCLKALNRANDEIPRLFDNSDIPMLFLDTQLRIRHFTAAAREMFALSLQDSGRVIGEVAHYFDALLQQDAEWVLRFLMPKQKELRGLNSECFIQCIRPTHNPDNIVDGLVVTFIDVSYLKKIQRRLTRSKKRSELFLYCTGEAIFGTDIKGRCILVNNRLIQQSGFSRQELQGSKVHELIHHSDKNGRPFAWTDSALYRCLQEGVSQRSDNDIVWRKDGSSYPAVYIVEPVIESGSITGAVVVVRDMTEEVAQIEHLNHLARHDSLTGLINRREFEERLARILGSARLDGSEHVMCYLDLDRFKIINDRSGHLAGDELLRQVTGLLAQHIRKRDTLARLGGDEFGVLMEHCNLSEGKRVAENLREAVDGFRFHWEGSTHRVGVSIGVLTISADAGEIEDVLKAADAACYVAKEGGRNCVRA